MYPGLRKNFSSVIFIIAILCILVYSFQSCTQNSSSEKYQKEILAADNAFVGPNECGKCHSNEYKDWLKSDHFKAMMEANDSTIAGDFDDARLNADGTSSRFFKKDGKYFMNMEGDDGKNHDYEVKYTFGFYPLQQYLVEFPGGRMQVPRASWNVVKKEWFNQYSGQKVDHHDWLHWTHQSQNWNSMCASCHSTGLKRNYNESTDSYATTYSHITVSCESCHGKGKNHVDYINSAEYVEGKKTAGSYLLLHKDQNNSEQLSGCVQCHARRMEISEDIVPSTEVMDNFIPIPPTTENYFPDGQFHDEDYEYSSFTQSKMFHRGVKCTNCHNPHTGKILLNDNMLCMQCHQPKYNSPGHYFHEENSEGSKCVNCHMPTRVYMGTDTRRDHSFRIPRPDQSVKYNTPNACTNCHSNKNPKWAADKIIQWYGPERKYHYSDDLIPGSQLNDESFSHLYKLIHDTAVTGMIRATAINYLGQIESEESLNEIKKFLNDSNAIVRTEALNSLANFPPERWIEDARPLLNDNVRGVRITAAKSLSNARSEVNGEQNVAAFSELVTFLQNQSEFPVGNLMLADYYSNRNDFTNAEKYYLRSLRIDSASNYARLNLSSLYNGNGQNEKALTMLQDAYEVDPVNPRINYNLALLSFEMNDKQAALKYFERAHQLKYENDKFFYNYALFLQKDGNAGKAESIYSEGIKKFPNSESLNYGMAYLFLQTNRKGKAIECIRKLKSINPGNPGYSELFQLLNE